MAKIVEQDRLQVAFRHTGKERDDDLATILLPASFLQRGPGDRTAAQADRETFFAQNLNGGRDGILVADGADTIDQVYAQSIWDKASAQALDTVRSRAPTGEQRA